MVCKYAIKKKTIKPYFFGVSKEYWCVVLQYKEQLYHYYHGYSYKDKEDIVHKCLTHQEAVAKLKEISK
ncbi:MAG: hypothetical protein KBT03_00185 [Bacteroidales bacterium]|nr:hypothetical protein [Candidatus Scybalousia scybalohippi]